MAHPGDQLTADVADSHPATSLPGTVPRARVSGTEGNPLCYIGLRLRQGGKALAVATRCLLAVGGRRIPPTVQPQVVSPPWAEVAAAAQSRYASETLRDFGA